MAKLVKGTLDFETDPFKENRIPKPFASCIYFDDNNNTVIWSNDKCIEKTIDVFYQLPKCELYAHNGGKFDFWYLLDYADNQDVKIINGRIAVLKIGDVKLIDSMLLIPMALKGYKKDEIEYSKFEKGVRHLYRKQIINYIVSDCEYLLELVNGFHKKLKKKLTIGSAAIQSIKDNNITIKMQNKNHDEIFRPFYIGGRVQVFNQGRKKFTKNRPGYSVDINAAYVYAMTFKHPHGNEYNIGTKFPKNKPYFADIEAVSYGCLPTKDKYGELHFHCDGEKRHYKTNSWEINAGLETKTLIIKKINKVLTPKETICFKDFSEYHYGMRLEAKRLGDHLSDIVHKYAGNSGYGKFATNPEKFYDWCLADIGINVKEYQGGENYEWYNDIGIEDQKNKSLWRKKVDQHTIDTGYYDVATAASITGFVRAMLWRALCSVNNPHYCDTDGIICDHPGRLNLGNELGAWKIDGRIREQYIIAKKIYALFLDDGKTKKASKGANLEIEEIIKIFNDGEYMWSNPAPSYSIFRGIHFIERTLKYSRNSI